MRVGFTLLLFLCSSLLWGHEYYVSIATGDDNNSGALSAPFKTITKASSILVAGDVCYIMEGVYRELLSPKNSGQSGLPIVYQAYNEDKVTLSATEPLNGWTNHSGNIYKTTVSMALDEQNMIYYKGQSMEWARWPNNTDGDRFTINAEPVSSGTASSIQSSNIPNLDWSGGYVWYLGAHCGTSWTRPVTSSSSGSVTFQEVDITKWPFKPHNPSYLENKNYGRFYLFGTLQALDYPGEWFFDKNLSMLYFMSTLGSKPDDGDVEYAARKETILLSGNYIEISGINAFGGVVHITGNNCTIRNCNLSHCLEVLDELDNTDAQISNGAINIEGSNTLVENNLIEYGSANGVAMLSSWKGSTGNSVKNNVFRFFDSVGVQANPIRSNCTCTTVSGNTIYGCGRDGIYVSGANSEISWNDVSQCMLINNDGGVFYTVGNTTAKNSQIHHNWFHDSTGPSYADGRVAGIYLDNDSKGYLVHHNVVWNVTWTGIQMNWDNWYNNIYNNTLWNVGGAMGNWLNGHTLVDNKIYNNYANTGEWIGNDFQANLIDPLSSFVSVSDKNFMPASCSALIDNGIEISGITDGYFGTKPDIGAYESGGTRWIPGADWTAPEPVITSSVSLTNTSASFSIYPNPVISDIHIVLGNNMSGQVELKIYSMQGKLIFDYQIQNAQTQKEFHLYRGKLSAGIYIIQLTGQDWSESKRVILL